jgi:hypothetical protein
MSRVDVVCSNRWAQYCPATNSRWLHFLARHLSQELARPDPELTRLVSSICPVKTNRQGVVSFGKWSDRLCSATALIDEPYFRKSVSVAAAATVPPTGPVPSTVPSTSSSAAAGPASAGPAPPPPAYNLPELQVSHYSTLLSVSFANKVRSRGQTGPRAHWSTS